MTDQEAQDIYRELADMVIAVGLQRVVEELEEEFQTIDSFSYEDIDEKLLKQTAYPYLQSLFPLDTSMNAFSTEALYPAKKRLAMLIDAIEHAVVNVVEIEDYVTAFFKGSKVKVDEVKFSSNKDPEQTFILRRQEALSRIVKARALKGLLDDLRLQIH